MRWLALLLALLGPTSDVLGNAVIVVDSGTFEQRLTEARRTTGNIWVGWSVQRWADRFRFGQTGQGHRNGYWQGRWTHSWSGSFGAGQSHFRGRPLSLLIPASASDQSNPPPTRPLNDEWEARRLAILVALHNGEVQQVLTSDFSLPVDLGEKPLHWLGATTSDQSVAELDRLERSHDTQLLRQALTQAAARHQGDQALRMLQRQLNILPLRHPDVRRDAAHGLGFQVGPQIPELLKQLILNDPHQTVRRAALRGLRWQPSANADKLLQRLAAGSLKNSVQADALELLAQRQPQVAADTFDTVIWNTQNIRISAAAAEAAGLLPVDLALPLIRRAATLHPEPKVRARAVEALARLNSVASLGILGQIVTSDDEYKVQESALEALIDLPEFQGLAVIAKVAHTHPNRRLRAEAIEALGNMGQKYLPARQALMTLIDV